MKFVSCAVGTKVIFGRHVLHGGLCYGAVHVQVTCYMLVLFAMSVMRGCEI